MTRFSPALMLAGLFAMGLCAAPAGAADPAPASAAGPAPATTQPSRQQHETFEKQITLHLNYLLSLPPGYESSPDKKWPLILFLHGSGERGVKLDDVKKHGPPAIIDKDADSVLAREFVVVSPQCPSGHWWKTDELNYLLDDVMNKYHVDPDRVYLTGLSMGGFGTWDLAANYPDRFAAIVPMCGGGNLQMARRLKHLPIWVFHGDADPAVPVQRSDEMVSALKKLGADVTYTRYAGVGHDCWTRSYANPELYAWMLAHKRSDPTTHPSKD